MEKKHFEIAFSKHNADLEPTADQWRRNSYDDEKNKILNDISNRRHRTPAHNIIYTKVLTMPVSASENVTMALLLDIADYIRKWAGYDTFQITIDRGKGIARLLMDNYDYTVGKCIRVNSATLKYVKAYAAQKLGLTSGNDGKRYFLVNVFRKNRGAFDEAKKAVSDKDISPKIKSLIVDCISYAAGVCEGICK